MKLCVDYVGLLFWPTLYPIIHSFIHGSELIPKISRTSHLALIVLNVFKILFLVIYVIILYIGHEEFRVLATGQLLTYVMLHYRIVSDDLELGSYSVE